MCERPLHLFLSFGLWSSSDGSFSVFHRGSSLAFRRRSGGNSISDTRPPQGDHRNRSLGGTTYVKDGKRYRIKEGPQIEDLLMVSG